MTHRLLPFLTSILLLLAAASSPASAQSKPVAPPAPAGPATTAAPTDAKKPANAANNAGMAPAAGGVASPDADKIIAIINGTNVKLSDIERVLRRNGRKLNEEEFTVEKRDRILYDLITEILIEQYLKDNKAFNNIDLQDMIYNARVYALSEYMFKFIGMQQKPLEESDIKKFVNDHPDFFQGRRAYDYIDITIEKHPDIDINKLQSFVLLLNKKPKGQKTGEQEIKKEMQIYETIGNLLSYVAGKKVNYIDFRGIKHTEEIETSVAEKLKVMSPGEFALVNVADENNYHIVKLNNSTANPVDEVRARPGIIRGLYLERAGQRLKEILAQMRENVNIKIIDNLSSRADLKRQAIDNVKQGVDQKADQEYEKKRLVVQQMQEIANKKVLMDSLRRKTKMVEVKKDAREEISTKQPVKTQDYWNRLAANLWILSLPVLYLGAFYRFLQQTADKLTESINKESKIGGETVEKSVEQFLFSPIASWIVGAGVFWFLAQTSWNKFFEINYYIVTTQVIKWSAAAFFLSLILVWMVSKIYKYLPQFMRNWRFLFMGIIVIFQIVMLNGI